MFCLLGLVAVAATCVPLRTGMAEVGGMGKGAIDRPPVVPECHEKDDWAELVDQMDAWPEEPELTEEMDILGR